MLPNVMGGLLNLRMSLLVRIEFSFRNIFWIALWLRTAQATVGVHPNEDQRHKSQPFTFFGS
jgi:hypothetical protein